MMVSDGEWRHLKIEMVWYFGNPLFTAEDHVHKLTEVIDNTVLKNFGNNKMTKVVKAL